MLQKYIYAYYRYFHHYTFFPNKMVSLFNLIFRACSICRHKFTTLLQVTKTFSIVTNSLQTLQLLHPVIPILCSHIEVGYIL